MIHLKNVNYSYNKKNKIFVLNEINMIINNGEFVFLIGPSGSGKSTLIKLLIGEIKPDIGEIFVNDYCLSNLYKEQIPYFRRNIGVVFQDFRLMKEKTVFENISFAMFVMGINNKKFIKKKVEYVLTLVGLENKYNFMVHELSGGEQQRVAIARAIINDPFFVIADEPTGNLDPNHSFDIISLFDKINQLGTTILVVTHEKKIVNKFQKRVIAIDNSKIIYDKIGGYFNEKQ